MSDHDTLLVFSGEQLVQEKPLTASELTIGRAPECDLVLTPQTISRRHVRVYRTGGGWTVENLSASAPVRLNGVPLAAPAPLRAGDRLELGPVVLQLRLAQFAPTTMLAPSAPPPSARPPTAVAPPSTVPPTVASLAVVAPVLTVTHGGASVAHTLTASIITVGRATDNTIVIPAATISRHHAQLEQQAGRYVIKDKNSANGLLFNGNRITERPLADGDVIRIADELGNFVNLSFRSGVAAVAEPVAMVQFGAAHPAVTIGRAPDNTLVLNYPDVSAHHARITWQASGALLEDLGSTNGTFARGQRVSSLALRPGELIQIASHQLVAAADAIQAIESEELRLQAVGLTATAAGGKHTLLRNIMLTIAPRELVALVGGSGAGKSTLIKALSGVRPATAGRVLVNGQDFYASYAAYSRSLGYVPQDDIIHTDLTVARTLYYAAQLRLPPDTSPAELEQRITEVLGEVQLKEVREVEVSQLSGGQRKRVSIAVELLARPSLFFLDEPTTGLDPGLDKRMMTLLRQLADQGRTVALVTHATANIAVCDKVAFLARGGRLCFYGPPHEALTFFGAATFAEIYARLDQSAESGPEWETRFAQTPTYQQQVAAQTAATPSPAAATPVPGKSRPPNAAGWRQWRVLTRRHFERLTRDRTALLASLLPAMLISALLALFVPADLLAAGTSPIEAQRLLFLLVIAAILLGATGATREIVKERPIYERERLVNLRIVPYLGAKLTVLGLLALAQSVLLLSIVIWPMGLPLWGALLPAPVELLIGIWLAALGGVGLGLLLSAFAATIEQAVSLLPLIMLVQILLAGLVFPLPGPLVPLSYVTLSRWGIDSLGTTTDLNRLYYMSAPAAPPGTRPASLFIPTTFDLSSYDAISGTRDVYTSEAQQTSRRVHLASRWGIQALQTLFCLCLAGMLLRRSDRR